MRSCKINQYWKNLRTKKSNKVFKSIDFNGFRGVVEPLIIPENGVVAFCGLNGVGKSTILSVIKKVMGFELNECEKNKVGSPLIKANFISDGNVLNVDSNSNPLSQNIDCNDLFVFVDFETVNAIHNKFVSTENLREWLEQNESRSLDSKNIQEINSIMGKNYTNIACIEMEFEEDRVCPYFEVMESTFGYGSEKMGKGEYYILYLFWSLMRGGKNSTIILDEPELGISIFSQKKLMDYLSVCVCEKKFNLMITTHSPFVLERLPIENIKIVVRNESNISIVQPQNMTDVTEHLDLDSLFEGIFLVEDKTALDYLLWILEKNAPYLLSSYMVSIARDGDTSIKDILSSAEKIVQNPFVILGVFDGDVRSDPLFNSLKQAVFLPGNSPFEEEFRQFIQNAENRRKISASMGLDDSKLMLSISKHCGEDYHDFFINVFKDMHLNGKDFISAYCEQQPKEIYQEFIRNLEEKIKNEGL